MNCRDSQFGWDNLLTGVLFVLSTNLVFTEEWQDESHNWKDWKLTLHITIDTITMMKPNGASVMLWRFSSAGRGMLIWVDGKMKINKEQFWKNTCNRLQKKKTWLKPLEWPTDRAGMERPKSRQIYVVKWTLSDYVYVGIWTLIFTDDIHQTLSLFEQYCQKIWEKQHLKKRNVKIAAIIQYVCLSKAKSKQTHQTVNDHKTAQHKSHCWQCKLRVHVGFTLVYYYLGFIYYISYGAKMHDSWRRKPCYFPLYGF